MNQLPCCECYLEIITKCYSKYQQWTINFYLCIHRHAHTYIDREKLSLVHNEISCGARNNNWLRSVISVRSTTVIKVSKVGIHNKHHIKLYTIWCLNIVMLILYWDHAYFNNNIDCTKTSGSNSFLFLNRKTFFYMKNPSLYIDICIYIYTCVCHLPECYLGRWGLCAGY